MYNLSENEHKKRMCNLKNAQSDIKEYTRELRIHNYKPGQIIYYLGDYPQKMSITPTEYDYNLLKSYAENGVDMIQVHEEWNDTIEKYGSDKWHSCDHEGMLKFIEACHSFGIKIIPYCSASYIHQKSKYYTEEFSRCTGGCTDMHYSYRLGWAGSEKWRNFIIPRTFNIMDTYGFDGIFKYMVDYISSAGLRVIKIIHMGMKKKNGELILTKVQKMVMEVFEMVGFAGLLKFE